MPTAEKIEKHSRLYSLVGMVPDLIGYCNNHQKYLAFNIMDCGNGFYQFQIGLGDKGKFEPVLQTQPEIIPSGKKLQDLANEECDAIESRPAFSNAFINGQEYTWQQRWQDKHKQKPF